MRLTLWIYNGLWLVGLLLGWPIAVIYVPKARAGFLQKLTISLPSLSALQGDGCAESVRKRRQTIWMHAVSVGELNALQVVVKEICQQTLGTQVLITTTTKTAQEFALSRYANDRDVSVRYFPYDVPWCMERFIQAYQPDGLMIAETELWPNAIDRMTRVHGKPVMLINGRLSPRSFPRYRMIKTFMAPMLNQLCVIDAQSIADRERFCQLGANESRTLSSGNLKYHLPQRPDGKVIQNLREVLGLQLNEQVITFASTRAGEEAVLLPAVRFCLEHFSQKRVVIALRHPERADEVEALLEKENIPVQRRSQASAESPISLGTGNHREKGVILLDTIGELLTLYTISDLAIMGGSFNGHGGQNPLEPIAMKVPVIVGPSMQNFQAIMTDLLSEDAVRQVSGVDELIQVMKEWCEEPEVTHGLFEQQVGRATCAVEKHKGVINRVMDQVKQVFELD